MGIYSMKEKIRLTRESLGYTHEALTKICSAETLSKIENGRRNISSKNYKGLMEKFHQDTNRFSLSFPVSDFTLMKKIVELHNYMDRRAYATSDTLLSALEEASCNYESPMIQHLNYLRTMIDYNLNQLNDQLYLNLLEQTANTMIKNYKEIYHDQGFITNTEIKLLCNIAFAKFKNKRVHEAFSEFRYLSEILKERVDVEEESALTHLFVLENYSKCLTLFESYEESIELCNKAIELCKRFNIGNYLAIFLYQRIFSLEESMESYEAKMKMRKKYQFELLTAYELSMIYELDQVSSSIQEFLLERWNTDVTQLIVQIVQNGNL